MRSPRFNLPRPARTLPARARIAHLSRLTRGSPPMPLVDTLTVTAQDPRRAKLEGGKRFVLASEFQPAGDQPTAIAELVAGIEAGERNQVLLGATGTGKTFTAAKIIEATQRPAIILAPNKTLAAQLYGEFKSFFPENAVEYFVSYYDYYQPEAYVPRTDTYIEKESQINEQIDRMRHSATRALLERDDVIIVASVSCIYGIGSAETYGAMTQDLVAGQRYPQRAGDRRPRHPAVPPLRRRLPARQLPRARRFARDLAGAPRGPRLAALLLRRRARSGRRVRPADRRPHRRPEPGARLRQLALRDAAPDAATRRPRRSAPSSASRLDQLVAEGKLLEAQRLEQRTQFDLEMLEATGSCAGIENYSRYLTGRKPGEPPPTLFEYIPDNAIVFADESHVSRAADRRHVQGRLPAQVHPRRARLPPALLHGQPPAQVRGVGRHAPAVGLRLGDPRRLGARPDRRRLHRAGDPPHRPRSTRRWRSARCRCRSTTSSTRSARSRPQGNRVLVTDAHQAHGRGPDRVPARAGHPRALHALRHRDAGAHRDPARPPPRRLRRAGRHQPPARGPRHPRMRARRHPRRRQGGLPALGDLAGPDHRPRRPQRRRPGHHVRRPRHRLDAARHRRDQPPPREADRLQPGARHHPGDHPPQRPRRAATASSRPTPTRPGSPPASTSRWSAPTSPPTSTPCAGDMLKAAENLEFEEAARLRDEVRRLEAVDLAVADDPLARQSAIEAEVEAAVPAARKAGRGGTRAHKSRKRPEAFDVGRGAEAHVAIVGLADRGSCGLRSRRGSSCRKLSRFFR